MRYDTRNRTSLSLRPNQSTTSMRPVLGRGEKGQDGSNVLPTDEAIEDSLESRGLPTTGTELSASIDARLADSSIPGVVSGAVANDLNSRGLLDEDQISQRFNGSAPSPMALYYQALAARSYSPVRACTIGDSYVFGTGANTLTRYATRMAFNQQRALLGTEQGYHVLGVDNDWTFTGTHGTAARGLGASSVTLAAAGTMSRTSGAGCDGFTVYYEQGPGSGPFTVSIDGGAATTVTPSTSGAANRHDGQWSSGALTPGDHTILITATSATVISGIYVHKGDRTTGLQWFNSGKGGTTTADWLNVPGLNDRLTALAPALIMINLLRNDYAAQMPLATLRANLLQIIDTLRALLPSASIIVIGKNKSFLPENPAIPWEDYQSTAKAAVAERAAYAGFVDIGYLFPEDRANDPYGVLNADDIHLTVQGHALMADALGPLLIPTARVVHGVDSPIPPVPGELVNTVRPAISGTARVGSTLTVTAGTWTPIPTSFTYQWYRDATPIAGATAATYVAVTGDLDHAITCAVTASLVGYTPVTANATSVTVLPTAITGAITTDAFTGGDRTTFSGRYSDARYGGTPIAYSYSNAAAFGITSGVLVGGSNVTAASLYLPMSTPNYEIGATLAAIPPSGTAIEGRTTSTSTSTSSKYRATFGTGTVSLRRTDGSANTTLGPSTAISIGDVVALRMHGDQISLIVNGTVIGTVTDATITGPGYATITKAASSSPSLKELYVKTA